MDGSLLLKDAALLTPEVTVSLRKMVQKQKPSLRVGIKHLGVTWDQHFSVRPNLCKVQVMCIQLPKDCFKIVSQTARLES